MRYHLNYDQIKCSGCLQCQLTCSYLFSKAFQLSASHVQIVPGKNGYQAVFSENCTQCGLCADNCLFDALTKRKKEVHR
jgi:Fe-S-cluster-containing dehydrogenase component